MSRPGRSGRLRPSASRPSWPRPSWRRPSSSAFLRVRRFSSSLSGASGEGSSLLKHHHVNAAVRGGRGTTYRAIRVRARVGAGGEVQVLAPLVEGRRSALAHPVGDLRRLAVRQGVHEDGAQVVLQQLAVDDPLRVGRPGGLTSSRSGISSSPCPSCVTFFVSRSM